jgi:hypothetical protein
MATDNETLSAAEAALASAMKASEIMVSDGVHTYGPLVATHEARPTLLALIAAGWEIRPARRVGQSDIGALHEAIYSLGKISNETGLAEVVADDLRHLRTVVEKIDEGVL